MEKKDDKIMTIQEIMKLLYFKKETYFVDMFGKIKCNQTTLYNDRNNCSSHFHIEKWLSINDLLNVAHYLNNEWTPNWNDNNEQKYILVLNNDTVEIRQTEIPASFVYFPSENIAQQAIDIIGTEKLIQILQG